MKCIRNKYRAVKQYGKQTLIISDSIFFSSVKKHGEGELLKSSQIGHVLRKVMTRKMGEAGVMKMVIDYYFDKGDTGAIDNIADTRSNSIGTIKKISNANAQEEIIRYIMNDGYIFVNKQLLTGGVIRYKFPYSDMSRVPNIPIE